MQDLPQLEPAIRFAGFIGAFAAVALWEAIVPRRPRRFARRARWPGNLGLLIIDALVVRLLAPGAVAAVALAAEGRGWGLLNRVDAPTWLSFVAAVLLLDLVIYFQHVMFHSVPALWRLHRVHHADLDFDVTTGVRFHPIEIVISTAIKCAAVAALGAPAIAVVAFEILLNAAAMFNHANASLPRAAEPWVRWILVTPDMHRVHHSIRYEESSSNFGFSVPWWDRVFGTYRPQPEAGHDAMTIGVDAFREPSDLRLDRLLLQPFRDTPGQYPINRRRGAA